MRPCAPTSSRSSGRGGRRPFRLLAGHRAPAGRRAAGRADRVLPLLQAGPERTTQDRHRARPGARAARRGPLGDRDRRRAQRRGQPGIGPDGVGHPQGRGPRAPRARAPSGGPRRPAWSRSGPGPSPSGRPATRTDCDHAGLYLLLPAMAELGLHQLIGAPATRAPRCSLVPLARLAAVVQVQRGAGPPTPSPSAPTPRPGPGPRAGRAAQGHPSHLLLLPGAPLVERGPARRPGPALPRDRAVHRREPGSTWTSTPSATTARRSPSKSTTSPAAPSAPDRCSPSSPRTTPPPRWSTPTPTSPKPNRPTR